MSGPMLEKEWAGLLGGPLSHLCITYGYPIYMDYFLLFFIVFRSDSEPLIVSVVCDMQLGNMIAFQIRMDCKVKAA